MRGLRASSSAVAVVVAIVVVPSLVGQASAPEEPEAPEPVEASIKTRLEGNELIDADSALLRIRAKGEPPAGVLVSGSGLEAVEVEEASAAECEGLPEHRIAVADAQSQWCLDLSGIEAGHQVEGKLAGPGTTLSLTVSRRVPFWPGPFLVILGGLLLGVLVGLLPGLFRGRVRRDLIESILAENDAAVPTARVQFLREWVNARLGAGDSANDLMPVAREVFREGPASARAARAALADRLDRSRLDPDHGFMRAARAEAERQTHERKDFLADDGTRRGHPAYEWVAATTELERQATELIALAGAIAALPGPQRKKPGEKLAEAEDAFGGVDKPAEVAGVDSKISAVQEAIVREQRDLEAPAEGLRMFVLGGYGGRFDLDTLAYGAAPAGVGAEPPAPTAEEDAVDRAKLRLAPWKVATGLFIALVVVWAFVSLQQTLYAPKDAFGGFADYFALLTGAVGAAAAGAAIALVGIWFPLLDSDE